jgi:hypothetical protein
MAAALPFFLLSAFQSFLIVSFFSVLLHFHPFYQNAHPASHSLLPNSLGVNLGDGNCCGRNTMFSEQILLTLAWERDVGSK